MKAGSRMHTMPDLFRQLGLPHTLPEIQRFIELHGHIPRGVRIFEATFWNPAQRDFLQQALGTDADWAILVDQLNVSLRQEQESSGQQVQK